MVEDLFTRNQQSAKGAPGIPLCQGHWTRCRKALVSLTVLALVFTAPQRSLAQSTNNANLDSASAQKLQEMIQALEKKLDAQQKEIEQLKQAQKPAPVVPQPATAPQPAETASRATENAAVRESSKENLTQRVADLENPLAFRYKKLTIIPGGFIAAESVWRNRNENSDMGSSFGGVPFDYTANANLTEFHMSSRATRLNLTLKTNYGSTLITGFEEIDFYGVTAANDVKSNSFSPRQRQLWIRADTARGWSFTGGQMWSLMVRNKMGMSTGDEESAPGDLIEGSFILGHVWERQAGFRLTKNFANKVWVGFSVENPETTYSTTNAPVDMFGLNDSANATSPSGDAITYVPGVSYGMATSLAPDLIAKVAVEPGWGHYELKGIYRYFRTRHDGTNYTAYGAGLGWSTKMPLTKKLDFITEGLVGAGIGRYGSGGGPDITLHPDGSPVPVKSLQVSAGFEYRPTKKLSTFAYEGNEYYQRANYINSNGLAVGYGSPLASNLYCSVEVLPPNQQACMAQNRDLNQVIGGFWYRLFRGPYGTLQYGANYEWVRRNTWRAVGGEPKGDIHIVMTSVRFVLP